MDTAGMRESVSADNGFVGLHGHVHQARHHAACRIYLVCVDVRVYVDMLMALQYHGNLFERRVSGPLSYTVDRHFYLPCAVEHTAERVCGSHAKIVMAVC